MGCCRRRPRQAAASGNTHCKAIEQGGSRLRLWVIAHRGNYRLVFRSPSTGQFADVLQFIGQHGCRGPMSNMIATQASRVLDALRRDPAAIRKQAANGASLTSLLKAADAVLKQGGKNVVQTHHTSR